MDGSRSVLTCLAALGLLCAAAYGGETGQEIKVVKRYEKSVRASVGGFPLLVLRGTHRERGRAHGYLGAREIVKTLDTMALAVNRLGEDGSGWKRAGSLVDRFGFPERFVEEVDGMLAGIEEALPDAKDRTLAATGAPVTKADHHGHPVRRRAGAHAVQPVLRVGRPDARRRGRHRAKLGLPPFFPFDTYCIFAVDPEEEGLERTLDALWFGMVGAGFACLNEEGVYLSANDGGDEPRNVIEKPCPGALAMRMAGETMSAVDPLAAIREDIDQRVALHLLFHMVAPPASKGEAPRAWVFEHMPGAKGAFETRLRGPKAALPEALFVTNTPMIGKADSESGCERYGKILAGLSAAGEDAPVDFERARAILDSASVAGPRTTTQYSGIIYPRRMEMHVAVSPAAGRSATKAPYTRVRWSDVWALVGR